MTAFEARASQVGQIGDRGPHSAPTYRLNWAKAGYGATAAIGPRPRYRISPALLRPRGDIAIVDRSVAPTPSCIVLILLDCGLDCQKHVPDCGANWAYQPRLMTTFPKWARLSK